MPAPLPLRPVELPPVLAGIEAVWTILATLRPQQVEFLARFYSNGRNATEAARWAGYASKGANAKASGWALLHRRPKIAAAVRRIDRLLAHRFARNHMTATAFAESDRRIAALAREQMDQLYALLPPPCATSTVKATP